MSFIISHHLYRGCSYHGQHDAWIRSHDNDDVETEIIPVEKSGDKSVDAARKMEKALAEIAKK
jgi:hypothetical protein